MLRSIKIILIGSAVFLAAASHVQAAQPTFTYFSIASDPRFGDQQKTLRQLIQRHGKRGKNDLCVVGVQETYPDGTRAERAAWVIWKQDHSIILWEPALDPEFADLWLSRRYLRVPRDVSADTHGSTYMVTPDWVTLLRHTCNRIGTHFTIIKR